MDLKWPWQRRERRLEVRTAQEVYTEMLANRISPFMREQGFTGSQGKYSLRSPGYWVLAGFQRSAYSTRSEVTFTINLLVVSRAEWELLRQERPELSESPSANIYGGVPDHERIGSLTESGQDLWWKVSAGMDGDEVAANVTEVLRDFGIPWLRAKAGL